VLQKDSNAQAQVKLSVPAVLGDTFLQANPQKESVSFAVWHMFVSRTRKKSIVFSATPKCSAEIRFFKEKEYA
jgi:hypothetical protein